MMPPTAPPAFRFRQTPGVVFDLKALVRMRRGVNRVVDTLRPTLGPFPRAVAVETAIRARAPELLDSGGEIARRIVDLPEPTENVGAMLVRGMLWRLHERVGDGTVTAAILFQSLFEQGVRYCAAGGNPMLLREALERAVTPILARLAGMAVPVRGQQIRSVALSVCADTALADILGEVFHVVSEYGAVEIRPGQRGESRHEFVQGSFWDGGLHSSGPGGLSQRVEHADAALLISDLTIDAPQDFVPVLRAAGQASVKRLFVVCKSISEKTSALLHQSQRTETLQVYAVKVTEAHAGMVHAALDDLAALTGGKALLGAAGDSWAAVRPECFGRARRIWADSDYVGLVSGNAEVAALRQHIERLKNALQNADDGALHDALLTRIGKLLGGAAIVHTGGDTDSDRKYRTAQAKRAASTIRAALRHGVTPGGGVALLDAARTSHDLWRAACSEEERVAFRMLEKALQAPLRALLANCGVEPGSVLADILRAGSGAGYDARTGQIVDVCAAGILDVADVVSTAVQYAVKHAGLALTVNAVVHHRNPPVMASPDGLGV